MNDGLKIAIGAVVVWYGVRTVTLKPLTDRLDKLSPVDADIDVLARTIWGEARGEGREGMEAVASVIMNRVEESNGGFATWRGGSVRDVCLKPFQFSAWNLGDSNRDKMINVTSSDVLFAEALDVAKLAVSGLLADPTGGANSYHTVQTTAFWADADKISARVGNHIFYAGIA